MSVVAGDLKIYGAANIAEEDVSTQGGAIDTSVRYVFTDADLANGPSGTVSVLSDSAGDTTQDVTTTGRDAAGSIVSEALSLNGVTEVDGTQYFDRILKTVIDGAHAGNVTLQDSSDVDIAVLESGVLSVRRPFYNASANPAGGAAKDYYEKTFVKNNNAVNALLEAVIIESADPEGKITFDLEDAVNDTNTSTNRLTAPAAGMLGSFDSSTKNVPPASGDLGPGSGIGMWMKLSLGAGDAATKSTWTVQISGSTA